MKKFLKYKMEYDLTGSLAIFDYIKNNPSDFKFIDEAVKFIDLEYDMNYTSGQSSYYKDQKVMININAGEIYEMYSSAKFLLKIGIKVYSNGNIHGIINILIKNVSPSQQEFTMRLIQTLLKQSILPSSFILKLLDDDLTRTVINENEIKEIQVVGSDMVECAESIILNLNYDEIKNGDTIFHFPIFK